MNFRIVTLTASLLLAPATVIADDEGLQYMKRYADLITSVSKVDNSGISCDSSALKSRNKSVTGSSDCFAIKTKQVVGEHQNYRWEHHVRMVDYNGNSYVAAHRSLKAAGAYEWTTTLTNHTALQILGLNTMQDVDTLTNGDMLKVSFLGKYDTATGTAEDGAYQCLLAYAKRSKTSGVIALTCSKETPSRDDMKTVLKAIQ